MVAKRAASSVLFIAGSLALAGCSSAPAGQRDPVIEQEFLRERKEAEQKEEFSLALIHLDQVMFEYQERIRRSENEKAARESEALLKWLENTAAKYKPELIAALSSDQARQRGIAAAALGFTDHSDVLAPILNLVDDKDLLVRVNACFGLAQLADPSTPLARLNARLLDETEDVRVRQSASWTLIRIQLAGAPAKNFAGVWPKYLEGDPSKKDPLILIHALRGLGLLRDPGLYKIVVPYLHHPRPKVRLAALVCAGRLGNRDAAADILPMLSTSELNPNVRLYARKALKALTGNRVDNEFDVELWKRQFGLDKRK